MKTKTITIIGAGNMGSCLLRGLIANGYPESNLWISDPSSSKLDDLRDTTINITTDNMEAIKKADIILLAVKPSIVPMVLQELADIIQHNKALIISIAAGVRENIIQHYLQPHCPIIRAMPNTPALIGCGATALFANAHVTAAERESAEYIFRAVGLVVWVEQEKLIDVVTAVSGSGPAYFFLIIEAIQNAGKTLGLTPEIANLLTAQTAYGAARMVLEGETSVTELRKQVTSKGGTTEEAVRVLEEANIRDILFEALKAAKQRADELATMIAKEIES